MRRIEKAEHKMFSKTAITIPKES